MGDFESHGRLQCLCRVGESSRSEQTVFDRECIGRKCGGQGFLRVQGCSQGCAAMRRARRSCMLLMLVHGRAVHPQVCCWLLLLPAGSWLQQPSNGRTLSNLNGSVLQYVQSWSFGSWMQCARMYSL